MWIRFKKFGLGAICGIL